MSVQIDWNAQQPLPNNPARKGAALMLLVFVFLAVSRLLDTTPTLQHLHAPLLLGVLSATAAIVSGAVGNAIKTRVFKMYAFMTVWMTLGVPFAIYRRGALQNVELWLQHVMLISLLVLGVVVTFREVSYLMNTLALAALTAAIIGLRFGTESAELRLSLEGGSKISNPNDLAFTVLLGVPFWFRFMQQGGLVRKCIGAGALLPIMVCFLQTGSRGGLVALGFMALAVFVRSSWRVKIEIALAAALVLGIGFASLPAHLRQRYFTFEEAKEGRSKIADMAAGSVAERKAVLLESFQIALTHPLFGVGVAQFADAEHRLALDEGRHRSLWIGTHNTYTQLAAECGLPVLIIFVYVLAAAIRCSARTRKRLAADPRPLARHMRDAALASEAVLWGMGAFIFFAHRGYDFIIYVLINVALVVSRATEWELPALPVLLEDRVPATAAKPWAATVGRRLQ